MSKRKRKGKKHGISSGVPKVGDIPRPDGPHDEGCVVFSFKYVELSDRKFPIQDLANGYLPALMERLKGISQMPLTEFVNSPGNPDALRSHIIDFEKTSEKNGFPILNQLWRERPWQFQISKTKHGRIHGFLIRNFFYVVWFDPNHELWD